MKTAMKAMMLAACVLFMSAMIRMQYDTFADRATRASAAGAAGRQGGDDAVLRASSAPANGERSSARAPRAMAPSRDVSVSRVSRLQGRSTDAGDET